jgi:hypothetical protein
MEENKRMEKNGNVELKDKKDKEKKDMELVMIYFYYSQKRIKNIKK